MAKATLISNSTAVPANINEGVLTHEMYARQHNIEAVQFPLTFQGPDHKQASALCFYFVENTGGGASNFDRMRDSALTGSFQERLVATVMLPVSTENEMPIVNIQNDLSGSQSVLADIATGVTGAYNAAGGGVVGSLDGAAEAVKQAVSIIGSKIQQVTANSASTGRTIAGRDRVSAYTKTANNEYSYRWTFVPRNASELTALGRLIGVLSVNSSATAGGAVTTSLKPVGLGEYSDQGSIHVAAPPFVFVEEILLDNAQGLKQHVQGHYAGPCQVKSLRVFQDPLMKDARFAGSVDPVAITIDMTIQEIIPRYSHQWSMLAQQAGSDVQAGAAGFTSRSQF